MAASNVLTAGKAPYSLWQHSNSPWELWHSCWLGPISQNSLDLGISCHLASPILDSPAWANNSATKLFYLSYRDSSGAYQFCMPFVISSVPSMMVSGRCGPSEVLCRTASSRVSGMRWHISVSILKPSTHNTLHPRELTQEGAFWIASLEYNSLPPLHLSLSQVSSPLCGGNAALLFTSLSAALFVMVKKYSHSVFQTLVWC